MRVACRPPSLFVRLFGCRLLGCFYLRYVRVRRIARRIKGSHSVAVGLVSCQARVVHEARDVGADLRYLREVRAVVVETTFDSETLLVIRIVAPIQRDHRRRVRGQ